MATVGNAQDETGSAPLGRVLRGLIWSGLAALVAAIAVGLWGDWGHLGAAFGRFSWTAVPVALLLTLVNYALRFGKWHYYVRRIGARPTLRDSALIFVAGFALAVTPGKTGEFLKAYLLHRRCGVAAWRAAPLTLVERATDGFAVLILAGAGLSFVWGTAWPALACIAAALAGCALLTLLARTADPDRRRRLPVPGGRDEAEGQGRAVDPGRPWQLPRLVGGTDGWIGRLAHRPAVGRVLAKLRESGAGAAATLDPRSLVFAVGIGIVSWGFESVALWNTLLAFGVPSTPALFGSAFAALNAGTLVGAISLLPGGAGAAEAAIAAILVQQTDREVAAAATLLIRLCTLWFGALLGVGCLVALRGALLPPAGEPGRQDGVQRGSRGEAVRV